MLNHRHASSSRARDSAYALAPDVILFPADDGSARLLDLDGSFYSLSETASAMLQGVLAGGPDATVRMTAERYAVDPLLVRGDLEALLESLRRQGLIERADTTARWRNARRRVAVMVMVPLLRLIGAWHAPGCGTVAALMAFARICTATFGWGPTVDAWRRAIRAASPSLPSTQQTNVVRQVDQAVRRTAAKLPSVACKERALSCWYLLCSRGIPAKLIVGVQLFPLAGHCWCQVDEQILTDFAEHCSSFIPVVRYEAKGVHGIESAIG